MNVLVAEEWVPKDEGSIVSFGNGSPVTKGGTCNSNIGGVCQCTTTIRFLS